MSEMILNKDLSTLDDLLASALPAQVPDEVIRGVTPWKRAIKLIFAGLILSFVGTEFYPLDFFVSPAGFLVMFFGFGQLRKENKAFRLCWDAGILGLVLSILRFAVLCFSVRFEIVRGKINEVVNIAVIAVMVIIVIGFAIALKQVEKKAGEGIGIGYAVSVPVWYIAVRAAVIWEGFRIEAGNIRYAFPAFVIIGVFVALFAHALYRLAKELEEPGYAVTTASFWFSGKTAAIVLIVLAAILYGAGLFARNYKTVWVEPVYGDNSQLAQMSAVLEHKGLPKELIEMLNEEEIRELAASEIIPVDGPEAAVPEGSDEMSVRSFIIRGSKACNELIFFEWREDLQFYGTNGVSLAWIGGLKYSHDGEVRADPDNIHGRVFCSDQGQTKKTEIFADPRADIGIYPNVAYNLYMLPDAGIFSVFAGYSVPAGADHVRGYIFAGIEDNDRHVIAASFARQTEGFRLIASSAMETLNTYQSQYDFGFVYAGDENIFTKTNLLNHDIYRYRAVMIKQ